MNKRYYWIKLKTDFFNQDTIDFLLSQKNGCQYIVLYQMLCLNTANNEGKLATNVGEMIVPYDVNKIVRDTKYFDFDTVTVALELFKKLGLVYEEQDNILRITNFDEMVGSETSSAKRVREHRERKKLLQCNNDVTQEIEKDKEIEKRDKILDIEEENLYISSPPPKNDNEILKEEFDKLWELYPKKVGKEKAFNKYKKYRTSKGSDYTTFDEVISGLERYLKYIKQNSWYSPKDGTTWFNNMSWKDEYSIKEENIPEWFNREIEPTIATEEERVSIEELLSEYR
jgi:predicted phage replisome organizer